MESCCDPKKDKRAKSARPFSYEMLSMGSHRKSKDLAASKVSKADVWHLVERRPLKSSYNCPYLDGKIPC